MAATEAEGGGAPDVVVRVCVECGWEAQFEAGETPPSDLRCEKCGNQVFRRFEDSPAPSEARAEFEDRTDRDTATNDPPSDTETGDVLDLNNP